MNNNVLITGAHGFVGREVAKYFSDRGWEVKGLGHGTFSEEELFNLGISDWFECDITYENLINYGNQPNAIVHCAGSGSVGFSVLEPREDFKKTVESTIAVLEYCRVHSPNTNVIYPSSAGVYGIVKDIPIKEEIDTVPISPYGLHKKMAEQLIISYGRNYGISGAIIRLFSVCGPGLKKQLLWDACNKIKNKENKFFGSGKELRDWIHVYDAASLIYTASSHTSKEVPVVNGGSGEGVTVEELLSELFLKYESEINPIFSGEGKKGDPTNYVADIEKALEWGWSPSMNWKEIVSEYIKWIKEEME